MTDSDDLLQAKITGWDTGINAVSEPVVAFPHGFDDGRSVDAGAGFERILAKDGIVSREGDFDVFVRLLHVRVKHGQIVVNHAHQFRVDQGRSKRSVSGSLTDTKRRTVNHVSTGFHGSDVVCNAEPTVLMAVPVHLDLAALIAGVLDDFLVDKGEELLDAVGGDVSAGVANTEPADAESMAR